MKRILLAGATVLALISAPATIAQAQVNWNGFYVGANAGYAWGRSDTDSPLGNGTCGICYIPSVVVDINARRYQTINTNSFIGGLQAGFNIHSPPNPFVIGGEIDFNWMHLSGTTAASAFFTFFPGPSIPPTYTNSVTADGLFTARGRFGFAFVNTLIYATGGVAVTNFSYTHRFVEGVFGGTSSGTQTATTSAYKVGAVVGAGLEHGWPGSPWSVKGEVLFIDFGNVNAAGPVLFPFPPNVGASAFNSSANLRVAIARFGINYRF
jgi:outer membrane immunogenic protein